MPLLSRAHLRWYSPASFDAKKHPVFERVSKNGKWVESQLRAVTKYGLPTAGRIYRQADKLSHYVPASSREAARQAFVPATVTAADGVQVEIGDAFRNKIIEGKKSGKPELNYTNRYKYVKEIVSNMDLRIDVEGFVLNTDGTFPEEQVRALMELWEYTQAVDIECPLTDIFLLKNETGVQDRVLISDYLHANKGCNT